MYLFIKMWCIMKVVNAFKSYVFFKCLTFNIKFKNIFYKSNIQLIIGKNVQVYPDLWLRLGKNAILEIGTNTFIGKGCRIECSSNARLSIGANVHLTGYDFLACMSHIDIGQDALIGEFVSIRDSNHSYADLKHPIFSQGYTTNPIHISPDVWVGRGSIILPGVSMGEHSVVGANSVVNQDVDAFSVVAGVPVKKIKTLDIN